MSNIKNQSNGKSKDKKKPATIKLPIRNVTNSIDPKIQIKKNKKLED